VERRALDAHAEDRRGGSSIHAQLTASELKGVYVKDGFWYAMDNNQKQTNAGLPARCQHADHVPAFTSDGCR
jgi:hypothetical protein